MSLEITIKDETPELMQKLQAAVGRFVRKGAVYIEGQLKTSSAGAKKSGKALQTRQELSSIHIASAPGESPANDSERTCIQLDPGSQTEANALEARIGTPVELYPISSWSKERRNDKSLRVPYGRKTADGLSTDT
jgi:single-stranded DNA-binding protein